MVLKKKQIPVIALDSKDVDAINLNDIGCLSNCDADVDSANYIGKLNGKFRIAMHLKYDNDSASGFYFYEKMKKKNKCNRSSEWCEIDVDSLCS